MTERVVFSQETLTNTAKTPYSDNGDISMEGEGSAAGEVAKTTVVASGATAVAERPTIPGQGANGVPGNESSDQSIIGGLEAHRTALRNAERNTAIEGTVPHTEEFAGFSQDIATPGGGSETGASGAAGPTKTRSAESASGSSTGEAGRDRQDAETNAVPEDQRPQITGEPGNLQKYPAGDNQSGEKPDGTQQVKDGQEISKEKNSPSSEDVENQTQRQDEFDSILKDPEYLLILGNLVQAEGENADIKSLKQDALAEYAQRKTEETEEQIEEEASTLTPEQREAISKEFKEAFKKHPEEMISIANKTSKLAKAKANEKKISENQQATEEEKTKASEKTKEAKKEYDEALKNFRRKVGEVDPKLLQHLEEAVDNPDILKLLKRERNLALLKLILQILAAGIIGAGNETVNEVKPKEQNQ